MKEKDFLEFAKKYPVFTTKQVAAAIGDMNYSKVALSKATDKGLIRRLKRGCYTVHEDPVIYASHIYHPSYISLWYAFQYYGTTTQLPVNIEVMARRNEVVDNVLFIKTIEMWGYKQVDYNGYGIFMAELEKAIIDSIVTERVPVDEVRNAVVMCNMDTLERYSLRMPVSAIKKIGHVAETAGHPSDILYERIREDRNYTTYYAAEPGNRWRVKK